MSENIYKLNQTHVVSENEFMETRLGRNMKDSGYEEYYHYEYSNPNLRLVAFVKRKSVPKQDWKNDFTNLLDLPNGKIVAHEEVENEISELLKVSRRDFDAIFVLYKNFKAKYVLAYGVGFRTLTGSFDEDFGINIAERCLPFENITNSRSDLSFQSKLTQVISIKKTAGYNVSAGEAMKGVTGKPDDVSEYGNTITFGNFVKLSKFNSLTELNMAVALLDKIEAKETQYQYPKLKNLNSNSPVYIQITDYIKKQFLSKNQDIFFIESIVYKQDRVYKIEENNSFEIFCPLGDRKKDFVEKYDINHFCLENLMNYAVDHGIKDPVNKIKIRFKGRYACTLTLKDLLRCEFDFEENMYTLISGKIKYYNSKFIEFISNEIDKISVKYLENVGANQKNNKIKLKDFKKGNGNSRNIEESFMEGVSNSGSITIIHKKFIRMKTTYGGSQPIEIADVISSEKNKSTELISLKSGIETKDSIYSLSQSTLGMNILKDINKYEKMDLTNEEFKLVKSAKIIGVGWILSIDHTGRPNENIKVTQSVLKKEFKLSELRSNLLKLRIFEWAQDVTHNNYKPVVYFEVVQQNIV